MRKPSDGPVAGRVAAALHYERGSASLPRVLAGGRGEIAARIIEKARELGIPVREDADLATLLSIVEPDSDIPPEAMVAVAEVLAHVLRLNARSRPGR
jgi:flagellar biosynthesis protein